MSVKKTISSEPSSSSSCPPSAPSPITVRKLEKSGTGPSFWDLDRRSDLRSAFAAINDAATPASAIHESCWATAAGDISCRQKEQITRNDSRRRNRCMLARICSSSSKFWISLMSMSFRCSGSTNWPALIRSQSKLSGSEISHSTAVDSIDNICSNNGSASRSLSKKTKKLFGIRVFSTNRCSGTSPRPKFGNRARRGSS